MPGDVADASCRRRRGRAPGHPGPPAGSGACGPAAAQTLPCGRAASAPRPSRARSAPSWPSSRCGGCPPRPAAPARADSPGARSARRPSAVSSTRPASWVISPPGPVISSGPSPSNASCNASSGNRPASRSRASLNRTLGHRGTRRSPPLNLIFCLDMGGLSRPQGPRRSPRPHTEHRTDPRLHRSRSPAARWASGTCAPAPTDPRPTARPSASSAPCSAAGPTARSTAHSRERTAALDGWLCTYNHHRRHRAIGRQPPITRLNNLLGSYTYGRARASAKLPPFDASTGGHDLAVGLDGDVVADVMAARGSRSLSMQ